MKEGEGNRKKRGSMEALATAGKEKRSRRLSRLRRLLPSSSPSPSSPRYAESLSSFYSLAILLLLAAGRDGKRWRLQGGRLEKESVTEREDGRKRTSN